MKHTAHEEMQFPASIIDGTGISLSDFLTHRNAPEGFSRFCLHEFYRLLCVSVQTETEAEFHTHLDGLLTEWLAKSKVQLS